MKKLIISSNKGGVGKTSVAFNCAGVMAFTGRKVLLIDNDAQRNLTTRLGMDKAKYFFEDLILGNCNIEQVLQQAYPDNEKLDNIWVIPCSFKHSLLDKNDNFIKNYPVILNKILKDVDSSFNYCIFDNSPSLTSLTNMMSYCYGEYVLGVLDMSVDSITGLVDLIQTQIKPIKETFNSKLQVLGAVLNNYNSYNGISTYARDILELMSNTFKDLLFNTIITTGVSIPKSTAMKKPLITFEPSAKQTTQFVELTSEIIRKINKVGANIG